MAAPWAGGRRMRACSAPTGTMSPAYFALPVTFSIASRRGTEVQTVVNLSGLESRLRFNVPFDSLALGQLRIRDRLLCVARVADNARLHGQPFRGNLEALRCQLQQHRPRLGGGRRSTGPNTRMLCEPNVPPSQGHRSVSPNTTSTDATGTSRSSASNWPSEVIGPCPSSTLPTRQVTRSVGSDVQVGVEVGRVARRPAGRPWMAPAAPGRWPRGRSW